jgi:hypothetical protein
MINIKRNASSVNVNGKRCTSPSHVMDQLILAGMKSENALVIVKMVREMKTGSGFTVIL